MANTKNPVKRIREFCVSCAGGRANATNCTEEKCSLWDFRNGTNPFRTKREMTEEQRAAAAERLRKAREARSE